MQITFLQHALERMTFRKVSIEEVKEIIAYPDTIIKRHGKVHYIKKTLRGTIGICCERTETNIN
ncbi:MAG: DUF4258 domain-containing protein, partial [Nanoarchaeota archaeon]|nr:DUF4258 domain-containing protein [Nanoarchaeota archaeon]